MIKTIKITFYEPLDGILMSGEKSFFFNDKKDLDNHIEKWYDYYTKRYGYGVEIEVEND